MRRRPTEPLRGDNELVRVKRRELARRRRKQRRAAALVTLVAAVASGALLAFTPLVVRQPRRPTPASRAGPRGPRSTRSRSHRATSIDRRRASRFPILMYHVINRAPSNVPFPGLYVQPSDFSAQMKALAAAGYRAVTLDQLAGLSSKHIAMPGRPIVISFDNGYRSQFTNALPVLQRLGWPAVENIQLSGLPPSQGGLNTHQVRALVRAGWELDTQGFNHADLPTLGTIQLRHEITGSRRTIRRLYHVPVHWFCYPSGHYDRAVLAIVKSSGYTGATTVVPGWANLRNDRYRLPRLRVLAGTSPAALLALVAGTRGNRPPPDSYR